MTQTGQAWRRIVTLEVLAGIGFKGHHRRHRAGFRGHLQQSRDDLLVTAVHAVEVADGDRCRRVGGAAIEKKSAHGIPLRRQ